MMMVAAPPFLLIPQASSLLFLHAQSAQQLQHTLSKYLLCAGLDPG